MERPPESIVLASGVTLRRERPGDAEAVADAVGASLPKLAAWLPWADAGAADADRQRARLAESVRHWDEGSEFAYVIVAGGRVVGGMGLHRRVGPAGVEIGYWLRTDHTGRGIVTACAGALTAAALGLAGVERVEIHCDAANARSAAVPRRLGYRLARVETAPVTVAGETGRSLIWVYPPAAAGERPT